MAEGSIIINHVKVDTAVPAFFFLLDVYKVECYKKTGTIVTYELLFGFSRNYRRKKYSDFNLLDYVNTNNLQKPFNFMLHFSHLSIHTHFQKILLNIYFQKCVFYSYRIKNYEKRMNYFNFVLNSFLVCGNCILIDP